MKELIKTKLRTKKGITCLTLILTTLVLALSYGAFVITSSKYKASEMLISELMYGITITEDTTSTSNISGNTITLPANTKSYFYITVSSVNTIDSNYTLAYKGNINVEYTDRTAWEPKGVIKGSKEKTNSKTVRIVIDNNTSNSEIVSFKVYGGYTFNSIESINLKDGYKTIGGPYTEVLASSTTRLVDIIEKETNCITEESKECYYGGGSIKNYLQYPESENKKENLWRIIGTKKVGETTVAKLISETREVTTVANINTSLQEFYKGLENQGKVIEKTNKFNCTESGCETSSYNNIGLISTYEYKTIGGNTSYLKAENPYFALNNSSIKNITKDKIKETTEKTSSGIRPSIYLKSDVKVNGRGTIDEPYTISIGSDINIVAVKLLDDKNQEIPLTSEQNYEWLRQNKIFLDIKCQNNTQAEWNEENKSITLTNVQVPDYCTIRFKENYVTLESDDYNIISTNPVPVTGGQAEFTITQKSEDKLLSEAKVRCAKIGVTGTVDTSTGKVTINNITESQTCKITFGTTLYDQILADHKTVKTRTTDSKDTDTTGIGFNSVASEAMKDTEGVIYLESGKENGFTEDEKDVYYFAGNPLDNWVKFAGYYWRIVRTNEDKSVRLLYAGTSSDATDGYITVDGETTFKYNNLYNNPMYVGYMYGTTGDNTTGLANNRQNTNDSNAKTKLEEWYKASNICKAENGACTSKNHELVSKEAIYCNDRATLSYSSTSMYYVAYNRLSKNRPSYKCGVNPNGKLYEGEQSEADKFTSKEASVGNRKLRYPVGLMTADEVVFAGGKIYTNSPNTYYYLNSKGTSVTNGTCWWTISPVDVKSSGVLDVFLVYGSSGPGFLHNGDLRGAYALRPVVSLGSETLVSGGKGTAQEPYEVK